MGLALACWVWFFLLAPDRSFKVGVEVEAIPVVFKLGGFKLLRVLALGVLVFWGYSSPIEPGVKEQVDQAIFSSQDMIAAPLAVGLTLAIFFVFPTLVAAARRRQGLVPGGWRTPALAFFGWCWLGVVLLLALGIPQIWLPPVKEAVGVTLNMNSALGLAMTGGLIYLGWWGLPGYSLARAAAAGDTRALGELPHVRWVGLPAWVMFKLTTPRQRRPVQSGGGKDRKFCPSCMRPIDHLGDYGALDFDHCPHCKELIPAVFSLQDYIVICAAQALDTHSAAGRGHAARRASKAADDSVQRVLRGLFTFGVRHRATDIHLGNDSNQLLIRFRIDGVLQTLFNFSQDLNRMLISAIKVQAQLDISEQRKPQDGSFKTAVDDLRLDVRVNTSPASEGETASLRLIYRSRCLGSIENLGMNKRARGIVEQAIVHPHGLILVTGPTGSGKSTTLYNSLAAITDGKRNIITLEDPIEFRIDGLTQMQVDPRKHFDYASGLRTILRQDPDVIMVGEVRDPETAKMAVDASMTGHLVFTTLHTIDTTTAIGRLHDLGVDPHQHGEALLLIVAQRLVRLICGHCAQEYKVTREELAAQGMPGGPAKLLLRRGAGCDHCFQSGFFEREGIYEILQATVPIRTMITDRAAPYEIRDRARREGMRTLLEDGMVKVILGRTTVEELLRVTS